MRGIYLRSRVCQHIVAIALLAVGPALIVLAVRTLAPPPLILILPLLNSVYQFSVAPAFRLVGLYRYHSPMLKSTIRTRTFYEIHGGTSFDYVLVLRWRERGRAAARKVMIGYLEGLLDLADRVTDGEIPQHTQIRGTSYFFSDRTARRLGFELRPPGLRLRANLLLNLLDLTLMYSFTKGRWATPNVLRVRQAVIAGSELARRRGEIRNLISDLQALPESVRRRESAICA